MTELEIFRNQEWLLAFCVISLVGSFARIAVNSKYFTKEFSFKNALLQIFFGLVICFIGEIILKQFSYDKYRVFLFFASFLSEDILLKIVKDKSPLLDKIFNKTTNKFLDNEK